MADTPIALIVPIRVAAMPFNSADLDNVTQGQQPMAHAYLAATADFSNLGAANDQTGDNAYVSQKVAPPWMQNNARPQVGINLHWNLPAALRSGVASPDGMSLPPAPNRWLVTRIEWQPDGAAPTFTYFYVQSDALTATSPAAGGYCTAPLSVEEVRALIAQDPSNVPLFRYLGLTTPVDGSVTDVADVLSPFTAMGYGLPDFASFAPNCVNVFGMCDTAPAPVPASYAVLGWYSDLTCDPVSQAYTNGGRNATAASDIPRTWLYDTSVIPAQSLYFGFWSGIQWQDDTPFQATSPQVAETTLTVGNSPYEALTALIALSAQNTELPASELETVFNALQLGRLNAEGQAGFSEGVARSMLGLSYQSHKGAEQWVVRPLGQAPRNGLAQDQLISKQDLRRLNDLQAELEGAEARLRSEQSELFIAWYNYQNDKQNGLAYATVLQNKQSDISHWKKRVDDLRHAVAEELAQAEAAAVAVGAYQIARVPKQHLAQPADHTILMSGQGVSPLPPDSFASAQLPCFLSDALSEDPVMTIAAGLVEGSVQGTLTVTAKPVLPWSDLNGAGGAAGASAYGASLIQAVLGLDPLGSAYTASVMASDGDFSPSSQNPAILSPSEVGPALAATLQDYLQGQPSLVTSSIFGSGNPIALGLAGEAGAPIILAWSCQVFMPDGFFDPSTQDYLPGAVVDNYVWSANNLELRINADATFASTGSVWQGAVPLSPNITLSLVDQLQTLGDLVQDDATLAGLVKEFQDKPMLAQTVSGFHRGLGGLTPMLQLPVFDPYDPSETDAIEQSLAIGKAIGKAPLYTPMPACAYSPIRAGNVFLTMLGQKSSGASGSLNLVDEFGRITAISTTSINFPSTIQPGSSTSGGNFLPTVRLAQPSRLRFDAVAPAGGAIQGWIVPNFVDNSLAFYGADGIGIGVLAPSASDQPPIWFTLPGVLAPGAPFSAAFSADQRVLSAIAGALHAANSSYLTGMVAAIQSCQENIVPPPGDTNVVATIVATPLAVVQARLSLEVPGGMLPSPAMKMNGDFNEAFQYFGVGDVRFPLHLGAASDLDDGLVGFFSLQDQNAPYDTFYSAGAGAQESQQVVAPPVGVPYVTIGDKKTAPVEALVTLLFDPRCSVQATNGVSPPATLKLAPADYQGALKSMRFALSAMPLLTPAQVEALAPAPVPIPHGVPGPWTVVYPDLQAWQGIPAQPVPNAPALPLAFQQAVDAWLVFTGRES